MNDNRPIGVFDSGVGGVTVLKELQKVLPNENYIYLGDTARVPYGNKSKELIIQYTEECVAFLLSKNVKMIVIACNTASSYGYDTAKKSAGNIPIIEMISPASEMAVSSTKNNAIAILGTKGTIKNGAYEKEINRIASQTDKKIEIIQSIACPLFVPFIEEGKCDHSALSQIAKEYLSDITQNSRIDTVIMGCTHYPFIYKTLESVLGEGISLINTGNPAAAKAKQILSKKNNFSIDSIGSIQYFVTDSPELFKDITQDNLGVNITNINKISL